MITWQTRYAATMRRAGATEAEAAEHARIAWESGDNDADPEQAAYDELSYMMEDGDG